MASRQDPYAGYNFSVELDGITRAGFRECSGLENSQNAGEYREGTDKNLSVRKIPGLIKGNVERHDISLTLLDDTGTPKITWNLYESWPRQWTGPSFNATADEVAIEQLVLAYERIEVDRWT